MRTIRTLAAAALLASLVTVGATSASAAPVDLKSTTTAKLGWGWGS
jgi:ABC-type nitrate/sulfonate/bicarbonate transport system substrate-binding protein